MFFLIIPPNLRNSCLLLVGGWIWKRGLAKDPPANSYVHVKSGCDRLNIQTVLDAFVFTVFRGEIEISMVYITVFLLCFDSGLEKTYMFWSVLWMQLYLFSLIFVSFPGLPVTDSVAFLPVQSLLNRINDQHVKYAAAYCLVIKMVINNLVVNAHITTFSFHFQNSLLYQTVNHCINFVWN